MTTHPTRLSNLILALCRQPAETGWLEFKQNNDKPEEIGEYISALSNTAALLGHEKAYLIWGVDDTTHELRGTTVDPASAKNGNEELENWLHRQLNVPIDFQFQTELVAGHRIVVLEIGRATHLPVRFRGEAYIRVGSYKKKLKDFPEKERELWRAFRATPFELQLAASDLSDDDVLHQLDTEAFFHLLGGPKPPTPKGQLERMEADELILRADNDTWSITNLGAILFARNLLTFRTLKRKAIRVIQYRQNTRLETIQEREFSSGYASGFVALLQFISTLIPENEVIRQALRQKVPMYPLLAVRELVANALIHQDFSIRGAGPMVEIFQNRLEVSNPGSPLVEIERFLDFPPRSRNEALASLMRRLNICEERGSGIDKVVAQTETYQLPAPKFEIVGDNIRSTLFAHQDLNQMDKLDRVRACYLHACLKQVSQEFLSNSSLRERFGIEPQNSAVASRLIKESVAAKMITPFDKDAPPKLMKYVPWWAASDA